MPGKSRPDKKVVALFTCFLTVNSLTCWMEEFWLNKLAFFSEVSSTQSPFISPHLEVLLDHAPFLCTVIHFYFGSVQFSVKRKFAVSARR